MHQVCPQLGPQLLAAGFRHGFFGRVGGQSQGAYASLNCSYRVGDEADHVAQNLTQIAGYLGLPTTRLASVSQVHGCTVLDVDEAACLSELDTVEADALCGTHNDYALCVRTADCVPILVGCRATGAAAAIHAGWRGMVAGVIPKAIDRLMGKGARPETLVAGIGPHIGVNAFEVSPEVAAKLGAVALHAEAVDWSLGTRPHVHLVRLALDQLQAKGIKTDQVDDLRDCTFSNGKDFFSFRRDGSRSGRQLSAIRPLLR